MTDELPSDRRIDEPPVSADSACEHRFTPRKEGLGYSCMHCGMREPDAVPEPAFPRWTFGEDRAEVETAVSYTSVDYRLITHIEHRASYGEIGLSLREHWTTTKGSRDDYNSLLAAIKAYRARQEALDSVDEPLPFGRIEQDKANLWAVIGEQVRDADPERWATPFVAPQDWSSITRIQVEPITDEQRQEVRDAFAGFLKPDEPHPDGVWLNGVWHPFRAVQVDFDLADQRMHIDAVVGQP